MRASRDFRFAARGDLTVWRIIPALLLVLAGLSVRPMALAQLQLDGLKLQENYPKRWGGDTNRLKYAITSKKAQMAGPSRYRTQGMRIENFAEDGSTNIIAKATECLLNNKDKTATSTNRLELETGNGLQIEGYGYFCQLTNFTLYLSNAVKTRISRSLAAGNRGMLPALGNTSTPAALGAESNLFMTVSSDQFYLNNSSNLIIYTGNIHIDSPQASMTCKQLTIQRTTNGLVEYILADENVVILNKADQSRASGDRGYYSIHDGRDTLDLTGHASWLDGSRSLRAEAFSFDLKADTLLATKKVLMKMPRGMFSSAELFPAFATSNTKGTAPNFTNQFVEIQSEWMNIQMPGTNHSPRSITARTNVLMLSLADKMRATGEESIYNEANGILELKRKAVWQSDQRLVSGDQLLYDRSNRIFRAVGNGYLKLPVGSIGNQPMLRPGSKSSTNQYVEMTSSLIAFDKDTLTFQEPVRGSLTENDNPVGRLEAGFLSLQFSNQLQNVVAKKKVFMEQFPTLMPDGRRVSKTLNTENLRVRMGTNGYVRQIVAQEGVHGTQNVWQPRKPPAVTTMDAERVTADFFGHTNMMKDMVAEKNVSIHSDNRSAHGQLAVYTATNNAVLLTGRPTVQSPEATIPEADWIKWDRTLNKFYFSNLTAKGVPKASKTNQTSLPSGKVPEQPSVRQP
ncbi:MAG TPA: LptA/OstA family protein [Candidatus Saccharimonadales bacterium]|nr:LptA/OstA family protein [Candidatus Saccharimonadales bacterium]